MKWRRVSPGRGNSGGEERVPARNIHRGLAHYDPGNFFIAKKKVLVRRKGRRQLYIERK